MSAPGDRDFEELLRAALQAEAGSVEPRPGGLGQINSRLGTPLPLAVAWLVHAWTYVAMRVPEDVEAVTGWLKVAGHWLARALQRPARATPGLAKAGWRHTLSAYRTVERFVPGPANRHGRPSRLGFLRPVAVMAFAIGILAAGVYAGFDVSQGFSPSAGNGRPGSSVTGRHHGSSAPSSLVSGTQNTFYGSSSSSPTSTAAPCKKKKSSTKSKSSCKTPAPSPTVTPEPTVGSSSSPAPSSTTSPTSPPPTTSPPASPSTPTPTPSATTSSPAAGSSGTDSPSTTGS